MWAVFSRQFLYGQFLHGFGSAAGGALGFGKVRARRQPLTGHTVNWINKSDAQSSVGTSDGGVSGD